MYRDADALAHAAAALFVAEARQSVDKRGGFRVALAGGNTPRRTYRLLAGPPYQAQVDWSKATIFWGDERCVPPDDPDSNERMAKETLLSQVPIPPDQVHPMRCAGSPEEAARRYERLLDARFGPGGASFDLVLLGLGENGHTASLFPGDTVLGERKRRAAAVYVPDQNLHRVTLTAPAINSARKIVFLVSGAKKAAVLKAVLEGPKNPSRLPAQLIEPASGDLVWLVDRRAGKLLRTPPPS